MHETHNAIVDIFDVALTFPSLPEWIVVRDNMLHTIGQIFDRGYDVVLLDGSPESGKTITLAQFCRRHPRNAFSLFLKPASELAYDSAYCRFDLTNQISWYLTGKTLGAKEYPSAAEYRRFLHQLSHDGRRTRRYFYFVIDGISDIPKSAVGARASLLDQLPLGLPHVRFLMTGSLDTIPELADRKLRCREQLISPFSVDETQSLIGSVISDPKTISDLQRRFGTRPGYLASLRRFLQSNADRESILMDLDSGNQNVFKAEWNLHRPLDQKLQRALATVAFLPSASDIQTLADVAECNPKELTVSLAELPYLFVDEQRSTVSFAAEAIRNLARLELANLEKEVVARAVTAFSNRPLDPTVVQVLPELLDRQGDSRAYLSFLSRENLVSIFSSTNSLSSLLLKLKRGHTVAEKMEDEQLALQFALDRAAVRSLLQCTLPTSQLEATLNLSGSADAAQIANALIAVEDRLHALSLVVKHQKLTSTADPTLMAEVKRLCDLVQPEALDERAVDIASAIMHFDAAAAFELLKRTANTSDNANALDQAIAKLSIKSLLFSEESQTTAKALRNMLEGTYADRAEGFAGIIGLFADAQDAASVLSEAARLTKTSEKLAILQQWLRRNHRNADALSVSSEIVKAVLDDSEYAPNASVFRDATLPLAGDHLASSVIQDLMAISESQKVILRDIGPLVDYYRTRFHLARAETIQRGGSLSAFDSDVLEITDITELSIRASCFAWLHATLRSIPNVDQLDDALGIIDYSHAEVVNSVPRLLRESAEHIEVLRPIAQALAGIDDDLLCSLIKQVNTVERQDKCYRHAARYSRNNPYCRVDLASAMSSMSRYLALVVGTKTRQIIQREFISWVAESTKAGRVRAVIGADVLGLAASLHDPLSRANAIAELVDCGHLAKSPDIDELVAKALDQAVNDAESPTRRRSISYTSARALRNIDAPKSNELFHLAGGPKVAPDYTQAIADASRVALRSYAALVKMKAASEADSSRAATAIERIESPIVRCGLASELAMSIAIADRAKAQEIAGQFVRPIIHEFHRKGQLCQPIVATLVAEVAPALWLFHPAYTLQLLESLGSHKRDEAHDNILDFIIFQRVTGEPFRAAPRKSADITEESVSEALSVLAVTNNDITFYTHAASLFAAMREKGNAGKIGKVQITEFRRRIEALAKEKLPAPGGVPHEGYLVLTLAQSLACEKPSDLQWSPLIERAKSLPNLADAAFVCAALAGIIPSRNTEARRLAFEAAADLIPQLPLIEDRVDRSEMLLREAWDLNPERCKQIARNALQASLSVDRNGVRERRLSLIEAVHRFDEELAASLASMTEKQRNSELEKRELKDRLNLMKLGRQLAGHESDEAETQVQLDWLIDGCTRTWGLVNGGMIVKSSIADLRGLLLRAADADLSEALSLHAYVIEACYRRYGRSKEGPEYARTLFEAYFASMHLLVQLIERIRGRRDVISSATVPVSNNERFVVRPGMRKEAISWLRRWLADVHPDELLIVDPYFGPDDLSGLELIQQERPDCTITLLTTSKAHRSSGDTQERYRAAWHALSLGFPPDVQIIIATSDVDLTAQLHDRWWLSKKGGLSIGTSFNSLGNKLSEIHSLDRTACDELQRELEPYISMRRRLDSGARLSYEVFSLN